jgi:dipeptidyl aminopeptidase/acylaminoacyl peptidase
LLRTTQSQSQGVPGTYGSFETNADALMGSSGKLLFRRVNIGAPANTSEIWTMNADSSNQRRVTCDTRNNTGAAWSPNGQMILFLTQEVIGGLPTQNIYYIGANDDCGEGTFLTEGRFPDWSPVQQKIVFDRGRLGVRDVFVRYIDGSEVNVTNDPGGRNTRASWSPDASRIAFTRGPSETVSDIFVINEDGTNFTQLTFDSTGNNGAVFSPDGQKIAFQTLRDDGKGEIYVMNADGTEQTRLTNRPTQRDLNPHWSPTGQQIIFHGDDDAGVLQLFIMNSDGSALTQITSAPTTNGFPAWGAGVRPGQSAALRA